MLTPEDIAAIRERAEKATAGPFKNPTCRGCYALGTACRKCEKCSAEQLLFGHAYSDIPALLSHIDELEAKLATPDISEVDVIDTSLSMRQQYLMERRIPKDLDKLKFLITSTRQ